MIYLPRLPGYATIHIVGSGPSKSDFSASSGDLVISCNGVLRVMGLWDKSQDADHINLACDRPYVQQHAPYTGSLGIYVRNGSEPLPRCHWPAYVDAPSDHWEEDDGWFHGRGDTVLFTAGNTGYAALSLAVNACGLMPYPTTFHLWGLDGGGDYERFHPALERLVAKIREHGMVVIDHAGRL